VEAISEVPSGALQGYKQRRFPESSGTFYFCKDLGDVQHGSTDRFFVYLHGEPDRLVQDINLRWYSRILSEPGAYSGVEHRLQITVEIPKKKEDHQCRATVLMTCDWAESWCEDYRELRFEIDRKYTGPKSADYAYGDKVRQMNNATANCWFEQLVQQNPKCADDRSLIAEKERINGLLNSYLPSVWEKPGYTKTRQE
jgi:hypothetical protein